MHLHLVGRDRILVDGPISVCSGEEGTCMKGSMYCKSTTGISTANRESSGGRGSPRGVDSLRMGTPMDIALYWRT